MPENMSYLDLDIAGMDGALPLIKPWRVVYAMKITTSISAKSTRTLQLYAKPDGELPSGYKAVAVQKIEKTTTRYDTAEESNKRNANSYVAFQEISYTNYNSYPISMAALIKSAISGSANMPYFAECTVTYAIMPVGCLPV